MKFMRRNFFNFIFSGCPEHSFDIERRAESDAAAWLVINGAMARRLSITK
jgi:hypothetical protein